LQLAQPLPKQPLLLLLPSRLDFQRLSLRLESALLDAQLAEFAGEEIGVALSGNHLLPLSGDVHLKGGRSLLL
jgi:hypothetical protein